MSHYHAVVWLDHSEAHVIHISPDDVEKSVVQPTQPHKKLHSKSCTVGAGKAAEDHAYYHAVVERLKGAEEILVNPATLSSGRTAVTNGFDPRRPLWVGFNDNLLTLLSSFVVFAFPFVANLLVSSAGPYSPFRLW